MSLNPHIIGLGGTLRKHSNSLRALQYALKAAENAGATIELLDLRELNLPMYDPDADLKDYGGNVQHLIKTLSRADGLLISTGAYHGTLAGITKNALDFLEFLADAPQPYLHNKPVGLIATASGEMADVNSINAMIHAVQSLRGLALPLSVPIHSAGKSFDESGHLTNEKIAGRLNQLGKMVVETARHFQPQPAGV